MPAFNRERFLFWMLASIFAWQAAIFTAGVVGCFKLGGLDACPDLGKRYETTVNVMVATTLALLTGGAVAGQISKKPEDKDPQPKRPDKTPYV